MSHDTDLLQEICDQIAGEIDAVVSIYVDRAKIVASSWWKRIGDLHNGGDHSSDAHDFPHRVRRSPLVEDTPEQVP